MATEVPAAVAPWMEPATPASLCIWHTSTIWPNMLRRPVDAQESVISPIGVAGVIGNRKEMSLNAFFYFNK